MIMSTKNSSPLLQVRDLAIRFQLGDRVIVDAVSGVSFDLDRGETLALVGESGSGKSTTARSIMKLLPGTARLGQESSIHFDGTRIDQLTEKQMLGVRGNRIAMIFQEPMASLNPIYRIGNQITEMIMLHQRLTKKQARAHALDLLKEVMIPEPEARLEQYPHQLSGGQRQRVMIAMAIANQPELLIADEPTSALDVTVQAEILKLIRQLQENYRMAVMLITHDLTIVQRVSDRVAVMRLGKLVEQNTTKALFTSPQHPYTQKLLASEPSGEPGQLDPTAPTVLDVDKLRVTYKLSSGSFLNRKRSTLVAVDDVDLSIRRGETLGVVGESGSGKSTLGKAILRLIENDRGAITWKGERLDGKTKATMREFRTRMQVVFQDPFSSLNPRLSVKQVIEEGLVVNGIGKSSRERDNRVRRALSDVGLDPNSLNRFPHEFSGGQRQRIAIARALVLDPEFILLDEPTSALDLSVQAQVIDLLKDLQARYGLTYLFISHDLKVVRALCHRVVVMRKGRVVETGNTEQVMSSPQEDYTRKLVNAALAVEA
ncbi:ABC transporter ATP-binding protein [Microvirga sp. 3-52]|nr:ABC transporter ATP-binding protein [Microvirga sp. 3-52]MBS7454573.1 ABC transporter ATP-binding protein [Microvirga sp. 3-52]